MTVIFGCPIKWSEFWGGLISRVVLACLRQSTTAWSKPVCATSKPFLSSSILLIRSRIASFRVFSRSSRLCASDSRLSTRSRHFWISCLPSSRESCWDRSCPCREFTSDCSRDTSSWIGRIHHRRCYRIFFFQF